MGITGKNREGVQKYRGFAENPKEAYARYPAFIRGHGGSHDDEACVWSLIGGDRWRSQQRDGESHHTFVT